MCRVPAATASCCAAPVVGDRWRSRGRRCCSRRWWRAGGSDRWRPSEQAPSTTTTASHVRRRSTTSQRSSSPSTVDDAVRLAPPSTVDIDERVRATRRRRERSGGRRPADPRGANRRRRHPPTTLAPPPWAASTRTTEGGYLGADVGCARDLSAGALDDFFAATRRTGDRVGLPARLRRSVATDSCGCSRTPSSITAAPSTTSARLASSTTRHCCRPATASRCCTVERPPSRNHSRTATASTTCATSGTGRWAARSPTAACGCSGPRWSRTRTTRTRPTGSAGTPTRCTSPPTTRRTLARLAFYPAPDPGVTPIYGYAVASNATHTYLFGNTFEQNMVREGGFWSGRHSATRMYLARVPRGMLSGAARVPNRRRLVAQPRPTPCRSPIASTPRTRCSRDTSTVNGWPPPRSTGTGAKIW